MTTATVICDRNAGNSSNTYWRASYPGITRNFCVRVGEDFLRDSAGRVRRFLTREAAAKAAKAWETKRAGVPCAYCGVATPDHQWAYPEAALCERCEKEQESRRG